MATFFALLAAIAALAVVWRSRPPERQRLDLFKTAARGHDVRILRDTWGVPHVFGKTDADAAFGLAYAHAEDDFATIQGALLAARGRLASVEGASGAANDYMVGLLRVSGTVEARYATDLSPEVRKVCEAYALGLNLYASLHPAKVWPHVFPLRGQDVVAGFVHKLPLFFGLDTTLRDLFGPARRAAVSHKGATGNASAVPAEDSPYGSNAFAVGPARSADGFTRLAVNSHQPWDGPVAWYEASVNSDEGWDMSGGIFPGTPVDPPRLWSAPRLGPHREQARPRRRLRAGGRIPKPEPVPLRRRVARPRGASDAPIDVKIWGGFHWTVHREVLWSVQGPVRAPPPRHLRHPLREPGRRARWWKQWYRMNKARDLETSARRPCGRGPCRCSTPSTRTAPGTIAYFYNARLPKRAPGYDWSQYLPGDTSETLWTEYVPFDELPAGRGTPPPGVVLNSEQHALRGHPRSRATPTPRATAEERWASRPISRTARGARSGAPRGRTTRSRPRGLRALQVRHGRTRASSNVVRRVRALVDGPASPEPARP